MQCAPSAGGTILPYIAGLWCGFGRRRGAYPLAYPSPPGALQGRVKTLWRWVASEPRYFPIPRSIARRANARPISTKAEVTSGPPTRMRVGVFILFHS